MRGSRGRAGVARRGEEGWTRGDERVKGKRRVGVARRGEEGWTRGDERVKRGWDGQEEERGMGKR